LNHATVDSVARISHELVAQKVYLVHMSQRSRIAWQIAAEMDAD
jgi:ribonuclease BN (tRNA processing enzyme)